MCCTAGLPMQIALNMLLARARPHRLLIEPTGLGHPREVLASLAAPHYRELIDLRATVTLVDARQVRRGDLARPPHLQRAAGRIRRHCRQQGRPLRPRRPALPC